MKKLGRPKIENAKTGAERQALYRKRKAEKKALLEKDKVQSSVIDLSAVAIWNRK